MNAFFIARIVTYFTIENVQRVCSPMDKYVIILEYSQVYEYTVESRDSHLRRGERSQVLILKKQFRVCIFKRLFKSFVDSFRSPRSLSKNDEKERWLRKRESLRKIIEAFPL